MRLRSLKILSIVSCFLCSSAFAGTSAAISGPRVVAIATSPRAIAVGDLNADGTPDLVVAGSQGQIQIIVHNSDESFRTSAIYQIHDSLTAALVIPASASAKAGLAFASESGKVYLLAGNGDGTFGEPSSPIPVSTKLLSLCLADSNTLGHAGVLALDSAGNTYLIDPDTFKTVQVAAFPGATAMVTADFDRDGFLDIAAVSPTGLSVAFGKGGANFTAPEMLSGVTSPIALATADLDGLGIPSLIASDALGTTTFLTPAGRVFQKTGQLKTGSPIFASADLDQDGFADLIVSSVTTHAVAFYHGLGHGQFESPTDFGAGSPMSSLAAADGMAGLISDRSGVVAVVSTGMPRIASSPVVSAGTSSGTTGGSTGVRSSATPAAASTVALTATPNPLSLGHSVTFTATVAPATATGKVTFYDGYTVLGLATVTTGVAHFSTISLSPGQRSITARYDGDVNDFSSVSAPYVETVNDFAALGFGTPTALSPGPEPGTVVTGDFNNDGHLDIVAFTTNPTTGAGSAVFIPGTGYGTFGTPVAFAVNAFPDSAVVADFNGDGNLDLGITGGIIGVGNTVTPEFEVMLGNGNGTFQAPLDNPIPYLSTTPLVPPDGLAAGDFNGDGIVDVVTANDLDNSITVFLGTGSGSFQAGVRYAVCTSCTSDTPIGQNPVAVAVADFNRDGIADLAVVNSNDGSVTIFLGTGSGTFNMEAPFFISTGSQSQAIPQDVAAFDTNGDGNPDLVITDAGNSVVIVLTGTGSGTFSAPITYPVGFGPEGLVTGDFNGDLITDVAVVNAIDDTFSVLLGSATGGFSAGATVGGCTGTCFWLQAAVGDFNGDSISDVVIADAGDLSSAQPDPYPGLVDVFLGQGCSLNVNPNAIAFDNRGGSIQVQISATSSNCQWTASSPVPWVSVTPSVGLANSTPLTVIVQPNTSGVEMTTTITVAGQSIPVTLWSTQQVFQDVPPSNPFFDAINLLSQKGITNGCTTTDFCPNYNINRAQMAIFIVRTVYGGDDFTLNQQTPYFTDVPEGSFGYQWIQKMYELGITSGCGPNLFCPDDYVNRVDMAAFIIRMRFEMTPFTYPALAYFTDVPSTYQFFNYVQRLAYDQITEGCQTALFCPTAEVTRGQMAVFVIRGGYNLLLAPGTPVITSIAPNTLAIGTTGTFTVTGANTAFVAGTTVFVPPAGVTVNSVTVNSPTTLTLSLTAASTGVAAQPEPVYIQTGTQEAVLPNGLILQ